MIEEKLFLTDSMQMYEARGAWVDSVIWFVRSRFRYWPIADGYYPSDNVPRANLMVMN